MSLTRVGSFIVKTEISAYDDYIYMQDVLRTKKENISAKVHKKGNYIQIYTTFNQVILMFLWWNI